MKKLFYFLIAFLFIANISVYAFDNKYFSVSDKGWKVEKKSETEVSFTMPSSQGNVSSENDDYDLYICVDISKTEDDDKDNKEFYYMNFDQKELEDWKVVCHEIHQGNVKDSKESLIKFFEEERPDWTEKERREAADTIIDESSQIEKIYLGKFGKYKAQMFDSIVWGSKHRLIKIVTLNRINVLSMVATDSISFDTYEPYKEFEKTFNLKDKEATITNSYLHAYGWWILIIVLVSIKIIYQLIKKKSSE